MLGRTNWRCSWCFLHKHWVRNPKSSPIGIVYMHLYRASCNTHTLERTAWRILNRPNLVGTRQYMLSTKLKIGNSCNSKSTACSISWPSVRLRSTPRCMYHIGRVWWLSKLNIQASIKDMCLRKSYTQFRRRYKLRYLFSRWRNCLSISGRYLFLGQLDTHFCMWHIHQWSHSECSLQRYMRRARKSRSCLCKFVGRNKICIFWCWKGRKFCSFGIRHISLSIINSPLYTSHKSCWKRN